jgi:hypothetical protein
MGSREYTSYQANGTVRYMRWSYVSYLFAALVASHFAVPTVGWSEVRVYGQVLATDECQLAPASFNGVCALSVVPIQGKLALRKRSSREASVVSIDRGGNFRKKLRPGRYSLQLVEPRVGDRKLKSSAYRVTPAYLSIPTRRPAGSGPNLSALLVVSHKSRAGGPSIGISDGLLEPK